MRTWKEGKMIIGIKDDYEIKIMREGGRILGMILSELEKMLQEGICGIEIDQKADTLMKQYGVLPSFKGYRGFPNVICFNVNDQVVHGIPGKEPLKNGDIVTIDYGVIHRDFHTDSAIAKGIGVINPELEKFLNTAEKALRKGIEVARPGVRIHKISGVIQDIVEKNGYSVVRDLTGHGIGKKMHEDPFVPNFRDINHGPVLQAGMTIAIEPIITMGNGRVKTLNDNWTIITADGAFATQVEHTILITQKGAEILTKRPDQKNHLHQ